MKKPRRKQQEQILILEETEAKPKNWSCFKVNSRVAYELRGGVPTHIAKKSEIVNVVSNFQPVGCKIAGITQN